MIYWHWLSRSPKKEVPNSGYLLFLRAKNGGTYGNRTRLGDSQDHRPHHEEVPNSFLAFFILSNRSNISLKDSWIIVAIFVTTQWLTSISTIMSCNEVFPRKRLSSRLQAIETGVLMSPIWRRRTFSGNVTFVMSPSRTWFLKATIPMCYDASGKSGGTQAKNHLVLGGSFLVFVCQKWWTWRDLNPHPQNGKSGGPNLACPLALTPDTYYTIKPI